MTYTVRWKEKGYEHLNDIWDTRLIFGLDALIELLNELSGDEKINNNTIEIITT